MTTPIDYSRPVGWWCPVCGATGGYVCHGTAPIPRYLEIPEGQRPPAASEVEEAEVVTFTIPGAADPAWCSPPGWTTFEATTESINYIVTGAAPLTLPLQCARAAA